MSRVRLPWKRGPKAREIACRADEILDRLGKSPRAFLSLRQSAAALGVSTQPLRDWIRLGYLHRDGPRKQISVKEVVRFVVYLTTKAKAYNWRRHRQRIYRHGIEPVFPFEKLRGARFIWPKGKDTLSPSALARLANCHPSLIRKAIYRREVAGRRASPYRWVITRKAWATAFPFCCCR